ncbi:MAG: exosortase-associated EpsI family protein [Nitrospira sp.]|nr:exosortase-associated EpsI family protein [bacterium]MBL7049573.1 exosortase-associated EpsI family protein [Nitrospira sp.]
MKFLNYYIVILILVFGITVDLAIPAAEYSGNTYIPRNKIPSSFADWRGKDMSHALFLDISNVDALAYTRSFAYEYVNSSGQEIILVISHAGSYHYPKVCLSESGYVMHDLEDEEIVMHNRKLKTSVIYTENYGDDFISLYWVTMNKEVIINWTDIKLKQLYYSIFDKDLVGFIVRVDVPADRSDIVESIAIAKQFITELNTSINNEFSDYILGISNHDSTKVSITK